jgi:methionyl-tRNA synthetase
VAATSYEAAAEAWDRVTPSIALEETWKLVGAANAFLEDNEPWKMDPGPDVDRVMGDALEVLRIVAVLASPAIPTASAAIWERIGLDGSPTDATVPESVQWGLYPGGLPVVKGDSLFPRIKA